MLPDTLDLAKRTGLALQGIANTIDPDDEYNMWFEVFWCADPPHMLHDGPECAARRTNRQNLRRDTTVVEFLHRPPSRR